MSSVSRTLVLHVAALAQVPSLTLIPANADVSRRLLDLDAQTLSSQGVRRFERTVATLDGAQYTLGFNCAADADRRIDITLDGQLIGQYAGTGGDSLDKKSLNFSFGGNGEAKDLAIHLGSPQGSAQLDAIQLIETLPNRADTVYGLADSAIRLPKIDAYLAQGDTGATLKIALLGLPKGTTLADGSRAAMVSTDNAVIDITGWHVDRLTLTPPPTYAGHIALQVRAISTQSANGSAASITRDLTVRVLPGAACATPPGINPFVSYVNNAAVTTPAKPTLVVGALKPEDRARGIAVPGVSCQANDEAENDDESGDNWMQRLEKSLSKAFLTEMEKTFRQREE